MNLISKEDVINYLINKIKIEENEINNIIKIVDELYNLNNKIVIPLSNEETFCFRKRYGILDKGVPQPVEKISKEYNIPYMKLSKILENILVKFRFRIKKLDNYTKITKLSSIELDSRIEEFENMSIMSLPINTKYKNQLMYSYIITVKDLLELGIPEIKKILSNKGFIELAKCIHLLNILFIDELSDEVKKDIIDNSNTDILLNSSIYWISGANKIPTIYYDKININDIRTLIINMNFLPIEKKKLLLNGLKNMNLNVFNTDKLNKKH